MTNSYFDSTGYMNDLLKNPDKYRKLAQEQINRARMRGDDKEIKRQEDFLKGLKNLLQACNS